MAVRLATRTKFMRMIRMETNDTNTALSVLRCSDPTSRRQKQLENVFLVAGWDRCAELGSYDGRFIPIRFHPLHSYSPSSLWPALRPLGKFVRMPTPAMAGSGVANAAASGATSRLERFEMI